MTPDFFKKKMPIIAIIVGFLLINAMNIYQHEGIHIRIGDASNCTTVSGFSPENLTFYANSNCGNGSRDISNMELANFENEIVNYPLSLFGSAILLVLLFILADLREIKKVCYQ